MIKIQQALWGYSDGHHLLESSTPLSNQTMRILSPLTDLSGSESPLSFDGYLTGYPLKDEKCYALSKTWYATEMSRPGCVWTHTLFINYDNITNITATEIDKLFKRPFANISNLDDYTVPIILDKYNNSVFEIDPDTNRTALALFSLITQHTSSPIIISSNSAIPFNQALESLIALLGISFFENISFCTGSFSNRIINRKTLDLQIVPNTFSKLVRRSIRNEIIYAEFPFNSELAISTENLVKTKEFIFYCNPKFYKRTYWLMFNTILRKISLTEPFSTIEIISILKNGINAEDAISIFTKIIQAIYLPTQYHIEKDLDSKIEILIDLSSSNYEHLTTSNIIDESILSNILDVLYNESRNAVINLIITLSKRTINALGNILIKHVSKIFTINDFSSLLYQSTSAALCLIPFNLELTICDDLWKQEKCVQLEALKQLDCPYNIVNSKSFDQKKLLYLIFKTSIFDITSDLYKIFGDYSVNTFFDWCEIENPCIQKYEIWINLCKYNQTLSIERLKHISSPYLFERVISILNPYDEKIKKIPGETWELFYSRFCVKKSSSHLDIIFAQFILPIIIESSYPFSKQLTEFAFITVHNILLHDEMDDQQWNKLSKLLPDNSWCNMWDKCKRLRKAAKIKKLDIEFKSVN